MEKFILQVTLKDGTVHEHEINPCPEELLTFESPEITKRKKEDPEYAKMIDSLFIKPL